MTASRTAVLSPTGSRHRNPLMQLVETARRGDLTRQPGTFWDDYAINGIPRSDARPLVAQLIKDGLLEDLDPDADSSEIRPTTAGLSKIGVSR